MVTLLRIADLDGRPEEVAKEIGRASMLSVTFDQYLANNSQGGEHRAPGIHASEIHGCERRITYSVLGYTRRDDADLTWKKRFMIGTAVHEMLQKEFHKWALSTKYAVTFEDEIAISPRMGGVADQWDIHSHCDGMFVVRDGWDGAPLYRCLLEIKTASPKVYADLNAPKPEHIEQAHVYMACLDVPITWLLYWNKGNQNNTGTDNPKFLIPFNKSVWSNLENRFERVFQYAMRKELPNRSEGVNCEFCAFAHHCKPNSLNRGKPPKAGKPTRWMR